MSTVEREVDVDGKVVLITGGSRGIGFAAARDLGLRGATVVLLGLDPERAHAAAMELEKDGIDAVGVHADVSDFDAVTRAALKLGSLASPDILVVSAGVMSGRMTKTMRTESDEWRRVMSINLDGAFYSINTFAKGMIERRDGRVITVSACLGRFSGPGTSGGLAPYRVSKAGVNALTRNLAAELQWGARGVLVDAMCPNHTQTDMGGPDAPRTAAEGADTIVWLATRPDRDRTGELVPTGLLWEDRQVVPW
jgi:NAD(P)-dependent dehydrogenase (short-subunit alcohol dehydrogenase family)